MFHMVSQNDIFLLNYMVCMKLIFLVQQSYSILTNDIFIWMFLLKSSEYIALPNIATFVAFRSFRLTTFLFKVTFGFGSQR